MSQLEQLPLELLCTIFEQTTLADLNRLRGVSSEIQRAVYACVTKIDRFDEDEYITEARIETFPNVQTVVPYIIINDFEEMADLLSLPKLINFNVFIPIIPDEEAEHDFYQQGFLAKVIQFVVLLRLYKYDQPVNIRLENNTHDQVVIVQTMIELSKGLDDPTAVLTFNDLGFTVDQLKSFEPIELV